MVRARAFFTIFRLIRVGIRRETRVLCPVCALAMWYMRLLGVCVGHIMIGWHGGLRIIVEPALRADVVHHLQALMIGQPGAQEQPRAELRYNICLCILIVVAKAAKFMHPSDTFLVFLGSHLPRCWQSNSALDIACHEPITSAGQKKLQPIAMQSSIPTPTPMPTPAPTSTPTQYSPKAISNLTFLWLDIWAKVCYCCSPRCCCCCCWVTSLENLRFRHLQIYNSRLAFWQRWSRLLAQLLQPG